MIVLARNVLIAVTAVSMYAWVAADDWAHELELERAEQQRMLAVREYNQSKLSSAQSEDWVDTTPLATQESEPTFVSAPVDTVKKAAVRAKKNIQRRVKATSK